MPQPLAVLVQGDGVRHPGIFALGYILVIPLPLSSPVLTRPGLPSSPRLPAVSAQEPLDAALDIALVGVLAEALAEAHLIDAGLGGAR